MSSNSNQTNDSNYPSSLTFQCTIKGHVKDVNWVSWSKNGEVIATASADKTTRLWRTSDMTEALSSPLTAHLYSVNWVDFRLDTNQLATCSTDGTALLWDATNGKHLQTISTGNQNSLRTARFSPDGQELAIASSDETLSIWNVNTGKLMRRYVGHEAAVTALSWLPNGAFIISGSSNGDLRIWDSKFGNVKELRYILDAHDLGVNCIEFRNQLPVDLPHNLYKFATCGLDHMIKIWTFSTGKIGTADIVISNILTLKGHESSVMCIAWSPIGDILASGGGDRTIRFWNSNSGKLLSTVQAHNRFVTCIAYSPNGDRLASASNDKNVHIWKLPDNLNVKCQNGLDTVNVSLWTTNDVQKWLEKNNLHSYVNVFLNHEVNGNIFLKITAKYLKDTLLITDVADRMKILNLLTDIKRLLPFPILPVDNKTGYSSMSNIDEILLCPITMQTFKDPVVASDGYTYEREAIEQWLATNNKRSPVTNEPLANDNLIANRVLKIVVAENFSALK